MAQRYATALFALADEAGALDATQRDLKQMQALLADSKELRQALASPLVGREEQAAVIASLAKKAGFSELVTRFLGVVGAHRRLYALDIVIDTFLGELARRRGEVTAVVTSARALSEVQVGKVTDALKHALGAKVAVQLKVEPALLGGIRVKVGSRLIDNSVQSRLRRLQHVMKEVG